MEGHNIAYDVISLVIKIFLIMIIIVMLLQYAVLDILAQKTISRAEMDGYIDYDLYQHYLSILTFEPMNVEVTEVVPYWGVKVNKLGDPVKIGIKNTFKVTVFGQELNFNMSVNKEGINQGYYGEGY